MRAISSLIFGVVLSHLVACGGGDSGGASASSSLPFAACCSANSACASAVCSDKQHACSVSCKVDGDCPREPKSGKAKCSSGVCEAERSDVDCEHLGDAGHSGGGAAGATASAGGTSTAGAAAGGSPTGGGATTAGMGGAGGNGGATVVGRSIGDACQAPADCRSGTCFLGACSKPCSSSDSACLDTIDPQTHDMFGELVECVDLPGGAMCMPACINSASVCASYDGLSCMQSVQTLSLPAPVRMCMP